MMPLVKICGITNREDALYSLGAGARMLGFIFYEKSPRYIPPARAALITGACRETFHETVSYAGVFVNEVPEKIAAAVSVAGIDHVQLHGDEDNSFIAGLRDRLHGAGLDHAKIIQAFRVRDRADVERAGLSAADYVLFDAFAHSEYGGTGQSFDWSLAAEFKQKERLFLSGGISATNIIQALKVVRPFAVDLSSSVEREKGIKDKKKIDEFFAVFHSEAL